MAPLKLWKVLAIAFVVGVVCVVLPLMVERPELPDAYKVFLGFVERLGDALLIAVVLGASVERIFHRQEFREAALEFFLGGLRLTKLRDCIKRYLEISLIRTKWNIVYEIDTWANKEGYIELKTQLDYDMQNHSETVTAYPFKYEVEDSLCPDVAETSITYIRLDKKVYETPEQLLALVKSDKGYRVVHESVEGLQPYNPSERPTYRFEAKSTECFRGHFVSPFSASYPTIETVFTIWYDKSKFDVSFELTFGEVGPDAIEDGGLFDKGKQGTRWTITKPILPGQGFLVRCKLKTPDPGTVSSLPANRNVVA